MLAMRRMTRTSSLPNRLFQEFSSPSAPHFLQFGALSGGFSLECNRYSAGSGHSHVDRQIIGLSIGTPRKSEFAIASDKVERLQFRPGDLQVIPAGDRPARALRVPGRGRPRCGSRPSPRRGWRAGRAACLASEMMPLVREMLA